MTKIKVHNLIILDESGSMSSIKKQIISGFNETIQTIKAASKNFPEQEQHISFVTFNGIGTKYIHFAENAEKVDEINSELYRPAANTPLYDTLGHALNRLDKHLEQFDDSTTEVQVTILTDGYENASREYNRDAIKALIKELKNRNWTFTYIGAEHDVDSVANSIDIHHTIHFGKSEQGITAMFNEERMSREQFYTRIKEKREEEMRNREKGKRDRLNR